jgi:hypothetical protein
MADLPLPHADPTAARTVTTVVGAVAGALDELARAAAAGDHDDPLSRQALAAAVQYVEGAVGAELGRVEFDPLVLLQRRLARVHRLLLATPAGVSAVGGSAAGVSAAELRAHAAALRNPGAALLSACATLPVPLTPAT